MIARVEKEGAMRRVKCYGIARRRKISNFRWTWTTAKQNDGEKIFGDGEMFLQTIRSFLIIDDIDNVHFLSPLRGKDVCGIQHFVKDAANCIAPQQKDAKIRVDVWITCNSNSVKFLHCQLLLFQGIFAL